MVQRPWRAPPDQSTLAVPDDEEGRVDEMIGDVALDPLGSVPTLTDGVVVLRALEPGDVDQIADACQDERLQRYIPVPRPYERGDAEEYVNRSLRLWPTGRKAVFAIADPDDPSRLLGVISLSVAGRCGNAAYWVVPGARTRGVARRALRLLTDWSFSRRDLGIVLLEIHESNAASLDVAAANAFHRAGRLDAVAENGDHHGALLFARLVSDPAPDDWPDPG